MKTFCCKCGSPIVARSDDVQIECYECLNCGDIV